MIIGITGTFGAGKGATSKILMGKGYAYHSCSDVLRVELKRLGKEETIESLSALGNEIRGKSGAGELAKRLVAEIRKDRSGKSLVDSIRSPGEVEQLRKEKDFVLFSIEAPAEVRYERVKKRKRAGDNLTFEEFKRLEAEQMSGEGTKQNLRKCMDSADYKILNDGTLEDLKRNVESVLAEIERSEASKS